MAAYLFWELLILIAGVWFIAVLFFVYGWLLLKRQRRMITDFLAMTQATAPTEPKPAPHVEISRNEPLSKYKDISENEVDVSFVDENK